MYGYDILTSVLNDSTPNAEATQQNEREAHTAMNTATSEATPNSTQSQYVRRYSHHSGAELCKQPKPIPYLIKGYMRKGGLGMIHGESGCGKSFVVFDMAGSIAHEDITDWHGVPLHHGQVLYFAGEGADGINARLACWCNERNVNPDKLNLEVIDEIFKLDCEKEDTAHNIENTIAEIKSYGNVSLVIFDTVNVYMKAEENSNTDVGNFCQICRKIIQECGCSVLLVHHTGLSTEAKNRGRGASALKGAVDFELHLKKDVDILTLSTPKIKDGKEKPDLAFKLTEHVIPDWYDEDGEAITSCTIELAKGIMEYREKEQAEKKKPKLTQGQIFARKTYSEAAKQYGKIIVDNAETGHETILLDVEDWRKVFYNQSTAEGNYKRTAFNRAKKELAEYTNTLTIQRKEGIEYYCLDLSGDTEPSYRAEIRVGIKAREKAETEAQPEERTGNLF